MAEKTISAADAIEQGYTYCLQEGYDYVEDISDIDPATFSEETYHVCEKSPVSPYITDQIRRLVEEHFESLDHPFDQDLITDALSKVPDESFTALEKIIDDELVAIRYWNNSGIRLVS